MFTARYLSHQLQSAGHSKPINLYISFTDDEHGIVPAIGDYVELVLALLRKWYGLDPLSIVHSVIVKATLQVIQFARYVPLIATGNNPLHFICRHRRPTMARVLIILLSVACVSTLANEADSNDAGYKNSDCVTHTVRNHTTSVVNTITRCRDDAANGLTTHEPKPESIENKTTEDPIPNRELLNNSDELPDQESIADSNSWITKSNLALNFSSGHCYCSNKNC